MWNPNEHSDDDNLKWCWLRAAEWGAWPLFLTQPIIPFLFLYFVWWQLIVFIIILTWIWTLIRYNYVSVLLAGMGAYFVVLKWFVSIGIGIYFLINKNYFLALLSALYPLGVLLLMLVVPPTKIGILQQKFMNRLGYIRNREEEI